MWVALEICLHHVAFGERLRVLTARAGFIVCGVRLRLGLERRNNFDRQSGTQAAGTFRHDNRTRRHATGQVSRLSSKAFGKLLHLARLNGWWPKRHRRSGPRRTGTPTVILPYHRPLPAGFHLEARCGQGPDARADQSQCHRADRHRREYPIRFQRSVAGGSGGRVSGAIQCRRTSRRRALVRIVGIRRIRSAACHGGLMLAFFCPRTGTHYCYVHESIAHPTPVST